MNKRKLLVLVSMIVMAIAVCAVGTYAYLTDDTGVVTNEFSIGNVDIELDEADVDLYGEIETDDRVTENEYKLIPGHTYVKDPTVHVIAESENCYIYVEITDEIAAIEAADTVATQMADNGWSLVTGTENIYAYKDIVEYNETEDQDFIVFGEFTIKGDADVTAYEGKTITVRAYAVQADGFTDSDAAWTATFGAPEEK